jgi:hypothetical protein
VKARYVLLPVVVFSALSLVGACSSDSGSTSGTGATGGAAEGGVGATTTGATSSMAGDESAGGMSSTNGGAPVGGETMAAGGVPAEGGATTGGASTAGAGGASDLCADLNLDCPNDNNPCTEDACNPETGECGIPRTDTACDDNVYCNGTDLCDAGECTVHSGNPCASNTCDEPGKSCQCASKDDCSADQPGDWSDCVYADDCVTSGTQSRPVTSYTCTTATGKCVGKATIEMRACTRETEGIACTDDKVLCDGTEACKAGKCTSRRMSAVFAVAPGSKALTLGAAPGRSAVTTILWPALGHARTPRCALASSRRF